MHAHVNCYFHSMFLHRGCEKNSTATYIIVTFSWKLPLHDDEFYLPHYSEKASLPKSWQVVEYSLGTQTAKGPMIIRSQCIEIII